MSKIDSDWIDYETRYYDPFRGPMQVQDQINTSRLSFVQLLWPVFDQIEEIKNEQCSNDL
jgi:hypothetical protein